MRNRRTILKMLSDLGVSLGYFGCMAGQASPILQAIRTTSSVPSRVGTICALTQDPYSRDSACMSPLIETLRGYSLDTPHGRALLEKAVDDDYRALNVRVLDGWVIADAEIAICHMLKAKENIGAI